MTVYSVSYDLRTPGRDYESLLAALRKANAHHAQKSMWLLDTSWTAGQVRDWVGNLVDQNDMVFVAEVPKNWASRNMANTAEWLKQHVLV